MAESCQIGTSCAYEVVSNWHDLSKFVIFFKTDHILVKNKKNNPMMVKKPSLGEQYSRSMVTCG